MDSIQLVSADITVSFTSKNATTASSPPMLCQLNTVWNCSTADFPHSYHEPTRVSTQSTPRYNVLVTDEMYAYFDIYVQFWALFILSCCGLFTNAFNILVFTRQGFNEGVNVTLMAISCWDLLKCIAAFFHRIYGPLSLVSPALSTSWRNFTFPYVEYTPMICSYISFSLATYVSIERCICVIKPFTVKSTFTPKFTLFVVSSISATVCAAFIIIYFIYQVVFVYNHAFNATIAIYTYSKFYYNNQQIFMVYYKCAAIFIPSISFFIMFISTVITIHALRRSMAFIRKQETTKVLGNLKSGISLREKQVSKMLLTVIIINICNLLPRTIYYIAQLAEPEFYLLKRYHNLVLVTSEFLFVLHFTNSSFNFFIFLSMSSNFRSTFYSFFNTKTNNLV